MQGGILKAMAPKTCPPKVSSTANGTASSGGKDEQQRPNRVLPQNGRRASAALFF